MKHLVRKFLRREDGVVSADWVVLAAALVGLAIGAFALVEAGTQTRLSAFVSTMAEREAAF